MFFWKIGVLNLFLFFFANFAKLKTFCKNLSASIILVLELNATFVPNLTFLGLLSSEISFGEKTATHPPTLTDTQLISPSMNESVNRNAELRNY